MGLLRNLNESWIDISTDDPRGVFDPKRKFRVNDPEAHIRRLESFGAGIGVNLTDNRAFSNKRMYTFESPSGDDVSLSFDEHDEAFIYTRGHIDESMDTLLKSIGETRRPESHPESSAWYNLDGTRSPFRHHAQILPDIQYRRYHNEILGETTKGLARPTGGVSPHRQSWGRQGWGTYSGFTDEDKESNFKERTADFRNDIRQRIVYPGRDVSELVEHMLRNPTRDAYRRANDPEMFSSQFVKIRTPSGDDVVDLSTGNWAKIDPDGYFPH